LTFGPRPGDVERVEKIGVGRWIELQLHLERIDDAEGNPALDAKLNDFPAMRLSTEELIRRYPPPPVIQQVDAGRIGIPADPVERAIYANALAELQQRKQARQKAAGTEQTRTTGGGQTPVNPPVEGSDFNQTMNVASLLGMPAVQRWNAVLMMRPARCGR
jgi:hypothetical protein